MTKFTLSQSIPRVALSVLLQSYNIFSKIYQQNILLPREIKFELFEKKSKSNRTFHIEYRNKHLRFLTYRE